MFGEGLKRACLSVARQSAQPFGQVSTDRHMDTNRVDVKDCSSAFPASSLVKAALLADWRSVIRHLVSGAAADDAFRLRASSYGGQIGQSAPCTIAIWRLVVSVPAS
jgi:hypothetical protein